MNKHILYKLTFPDGMVYIGVAKSIEIRWTNKGKGYHGQPVYDLIYKHGWNNVKKEVLLRLGPSVENDNTIRTMERELIKAYGERCCNSICNPARADYMKETHKKHNPPKVYWTLHEETKPAKDWCAQYGVNYTTVTTRMRRYGMSLEEALMLPPMPRNRRSDAKAYLAERGFDVSNF